jgi:hypothetical protein
LDPIARTTLLLPPHGRTCGYVAAIRETGWIPNQISRPIYARLDAILSRAVTSRRDGAVYFDPGIRARRAKQQGIVANFALQIMVSE